jgi:hypothetical protein
METRRSRQREKEGGAWEPGAGGSEDEGFTKKAPFSLEGLPYRSALCAGLGGDFAPLKKWSSLHTVV